MRGSGRDAKAFSSPPDGQPPNGCKQLLGDLPFWSTQSLTLRLRAGEARHHSLLNPRALELRNRGQDVELQPPRWRRCVDALPKGHERNPQRLEFIEQQNQVPEVPSETVQPPADENIEAPSTSGFEEFIERRTAVLGTRHASVNVFDGRPASALHIRPKLGELVLDMLVERRDTSIDGASHGGLVRRAFRCNSDVTASSRPAPYRPSSTNSTPSFSAKTVTSTSPSPSHKNL